MAGHNAQSAEFAHSVEQYYQAAEKKDWPTAYHMRTSDFKQDVTRSVYLKQMADSGETLTSYKVCNILAYADQSGSIQQARLLWRSTGRDGFLWVRKVDKPGRKVAV